MTKTIFIILILLCPSLGYSQGNISFVRSTNSDLVKILNNVREYKTFSSKSIAVSLFLITGSSNVRSETDEVTDCLYVAVSEFGEYPEQRLFLLKDIFAVENISISADKANGDFLSFSYFDQRLKVRKKMNFSVRISGIQKR